MHNTQEFEDIVEQLRKKTELAKASITSITRQLDNSEAEWRSEYHKTGTWSSRSTGDATSEKSFLLDKRLTAYLRKKENLEAAHSQAIKMLKEKELGQCTFKPVLNLNSKVIVELSPRKFTPLHHPKVPKEPLTPEPGNSPKYPQISPISRALLEKQDRSAPVYERLQVLEQERRNRLEQQSREKMAEEEKLVTGAPKLSRNTMEIIRRRAQAGEIPSQSSGVVYRLGELEVRSQFSALRIRLIL
jgi:hypothetical protein